MGKWKDLRLVCKEGQEMNHLKGFCREENI